MATLLKLLVQTAEYFDVGHLFYSTTESDVEGIWMDNYSIKIWESETQSKPSRRLVLTVNNVHALNAEIALQQVMRENNLFAVSLAEVSWNNGLNRKEFKNYSIE